MLTDVPEILEVDHNLIKITDCEDDLDMAASSVVRVVELLSAPSVEARVRQSAITQLSVMTEDPRLHQVFIDNRGVELFISILQQVMGEINEDTGCSAIPIVATLKNLARHNSTIRQSLSQHEQFILHLIKGMFQLSEWRLQRDGAQLLALLVYADYVLSCPASVSLPHLITQTLHLPWLCQSHWAVSPHSTPSLRGVVLGEMGAERLLSTYWAVLTVGLDHLLELSHVTENNTPMALSQRTLRQLQASNIPHGCRCSLYSFQNATTHTAALQALAELTSYLEISWLTEPSNLASLPWKNTFKRFLLIPPSGQDDFNLLFLVLKFLQFLLEVSPEQSLWVSEALLCPPHTLLQLIMVANSPSHDQEMWKKICLNTLAVCKKCLHFNVGGSDWQTLVMLVLRCLGQSHTQEYYSLALLDSKLQVLLAALRSRQSADSAANLWQLLTAFHCESPHSFMGISITRNTVLCLNKMLSLTQDWEGECEPNIRWLLHEGGLCSSGDVVVRAAALNLLSGLALTPRGAVTLLDTCPDIIHFTMRTVVDHCEASVVREYAAKLLTNINKHSICKEMMVSARDVNLFQEFRESVNLVALAAVQSHLEQSTGMLHTDPRFVKAGCWLLTNLLVSAVDEMLPSVSSSGLTTALCRTLQSIDRLMSPEIVSLAAAVCRLLFVCCEAGCDIAQLPDCAAAIMSFLDPDSFDFDPAESSEEVQSLWQETLTLLSYVLGFMGAEVILNSATVTVLSQCIAIVDPQCTSLRLTALQAVPALATSLTPNSEAVLCESLVAQWDRVKGKARPALLAALTALLGHSSFATTTALSLGLVASVITRLRELHLTLTIQTSSTDKLAKKDPRMGEMLHLVQLLSAALYHSGVARREAATHGAADTLHKLWAWCHADDKYLIATLNCLITFTADCPLAVAFLAGKRITNFENASTTDSRYELPDFVLGSLPT
ncbi:uncharacterized protein LOC128982487 [Macrosteles quadrilineatus]|uniref:uncharacterized protein LOC128982487 n=1 Tax=Macrosteles quadrilineatus TaxID=74068 RepID=UPI0023E21F6F|nr:uncharacterized protein LOC128982487 [Macrosteles quadrilineatus]